MFWSILFGAVLVLWGISIIADILFHLNIPIFSIFFGILLIYLGIQVLTGSGKSKWRCWSSSDNCQSTCMGSVNVTVTNETAASDEFPLEYKTVFGNSKVDLSSLTAEGLQRRTTPLMVTVDTVFGKTELILNKSIPTRIIAKGSFAKISLPDATVISFGSRTYNSHPSEQPLIIINSSTTFGETEIITKG